MTDRPLEPALVCPRTNRVRSSAGVIRCSSAVPIPAIRRAVEPRWLDDAKPSSPATRATVYPGLCSSWAAPTTRRKSITRLRLGAPPAPNWRERCSRETPSRVASSDVRDRLVHPIDAGCPRLGVAADRRAGGAVGRRPAARRREAASETRLTSSPTTGSSTPSTTTAATRCRRHSASNSPSSGRNGAYATTGMSGKSERKEAHSACGSARGVKTTASTMRRSSN